jgi:hypothetical protein
VIAAIFHTIHVLKGIHCMGHRGQNNTTYWKSKEAAGNGLSGAVLGIHIGIYWRLQRPFDDWMRLITYPLGDAYEKTHGVALAFISGHQLS